MTHQARGISNHSPVSVLLNGPEKKFVLPRKIDPWFLKDRGFREKLHEETGAYFVENQGPVVSPFVLWEAFRAVLRGKAQALTGVWKNERNLKCARLEAEILDLEARVQTEGTVTLGHRLRLHQQDFRILAEERA
ncbi:hypothetical protein NDU88_003055 [Pleurodeles waltl]|uniref:Uncharacterized protein n=1 Tax=Pleurodeles waltl TaxID=8319 RepID=A0AAV7KXD8_PLEWA|nr:hypothetical protein NDU88_003055 [Pleurodeles waltl]